MKTLLCNDCYDWMGVDVECKSTPLIEEPCYICGKLTTGNWVAITPRELIEKIKDASFENGKLSVPDYGWGG